MATAGVVTYNRVMEKKMPWWASFKKVKCPTCGQHMVMSPTLNADYRIFTCDDCRLLIRDTKDEKITRTT